MIFLNSGNGLVSLGVYSADVADPPPFDLSELLYPPQTALPGDENSPPPRPPYTIPYAPGTLNWPQGASRFAVGQYLVTEQEIQTLWPTFSLFSAQPVTLQLGGTPEGTGQPAVTFTLYPLYLLPIGLNRSTTLQAGQAQALYLLILVDSRYFLQTDAPDWTIVDGTTTWDDLDADLLTFLPPGSTADPVDPDYLYPSSALAPPPLASGGVVGWAGPLLDAICLASGRRFVSNTDGTCSLQSWATADPIGADALDANTPYISAGGFVAYDPAEEATTGLYVVPEAILCVYPARDATPTEVGPYEVSTTFAAVRTSAGYGADNAGSLEGVLRVGMGLWSDGTNESDLDAHALRWSTDWYAWLRGTSLYLYAGCVDFPPNGFTDCIEWVVVAGAAYTRVSRGLLNPRPGSPVEGYSGVTPLGPVFPGGAVFTGPVYFIGSTTDFIDEVVTFDNTVSNYVNGSVTNYNSTTTVNYAGISVYTGPTYYPLYDYSGSPFAVNVTNWTIPAGNARIRISSTVEYVFINSINPGTSPSGRLIYLYNVGQYTILIVNEAAAEATASKRILTTDENFYAIAPFDCVCLAYDLTSQRWRVSENSHKRLSKYHSYPEWSGDQSNVAFLPDVELHVVSSDAAVTWDGITNGLFTLRHRVVNGGADPITLLDNGAGSSAGNRFVLPGFTSYQFVPGQELIFEYDDTALEGDGAWHVVGLLPNDPAAVTVDLVTQVCYSPDARTATATDPVESSGTWQDLTGATLTFTPVVAGEFLVWGVFDVDGGGDAVVVFDPEGTDEAIDTYEGALSVDGVLETPVATFAPAHPMARATVTQVWLVVLTAAAHTLKLQGRRASGTGFCTFQPDNTVLTVAAVPSLEVEKRPVRIPGGTVGAASCATDPDDCCDTNPPVVATDCCPDDLWPATLYMHFSGGTGDCDCLDGETLTLTWDGSGWAGADAFCEVVVDLFIACAIDDAFYLTGTMGGLAITGGPADTTDCATYTLTWVNVDLANPGCTGTVDVTVNTTP